MAVAQVNQREIVEDVITHHNCFVRQPFFDNVVDRIIANIIDGDWDE